MANVIDVIVLVFADGTTHWFKKKPSYKGKEDPNEAYIDACFAEWKDENREMIENNNVMNAVCSIRMTEEKYETIVAEDRFMNSMDRGQQWKK